MKFLVVASYPDSILQFRGALLAALAATGLEVHVAAPGLGPTSAIRQALEARGYVVHDLYMQRTGLNMLADGWTLSALYRLMRRIKPDYMLGYTIKPVIYGAIAAYFAGVPHRFALITGLGYAFSAVGEQEHAPSFFQRALFQLYAYALKQVEVVFFQNPDDLALFRQLKILQPEHASVVVKGSGVNTVEYAPDPTPADPAAPVQFLLIARLLGDKGVREYAAAAHLIKAKYPQVTFHLVGWIDENPNAIDQAELDEWIQDQRLVYWGKLNDVRPAIRQCSVYVLPSYREGTPRSVLEAMAMGKAIITTDAPGCRETVQDGYNGYLVPVKSVAALAESMERFIQSPKLVIDMGLASRALAESRFDVNRVNGVMLNAMGLALSKSDVHGRELI